MQTNSSIQIGLRISGGVVLGLIGWSLADLFPYENLLSPLDNRFFSHVLLLIVFGLIGAIMLPTLAGRSLMVMYERISKISAVQIIANFIGMVGGLLLAALLAFPLARLPEPFGPVLPFLAAIAFASLGLGVMGLRYREIFRILNIRLPESKPEELSPHPHKEPMLLDTSVIIDGRRSNTSTVANDDSTSCIACFAAASSVFLALSPVSDSTPPRSTTCATRNANAASNPLRAVAGSVA